MLAGFKRRLVAGLLALFCLLLGVAPASAADNPELLPDHPTPVIDLARSFTDGQRTSLEQHLSQHRYLLGTQCTEADWRLFTTLVRFDPVYVGHFKCNRRRLVEYPHLFAYVRELYQMPGIAATVDFDHIKRHYYQSHATINPSGVVPLGPPIDFKAAHGRERLAPPSTAS